MTSFELETTYGFLYGVACLCFVIPPQEIAEAGFTVQNIFGKQLGDERLDFFRYHVRRSSLTLLIHSLMPLGELKLT